MLNKKLKRKIIDTEHISERAITTTIVLNHQRIKLMSVYFPHSGYADYHVEKCTERSRSTRQIAKNTYRLLEETSLENWELAREPNVQVLADEGNKRGDWMKQWLMLQGYTALNTMYSKTPGKQTTYRSPKGNEKQIDCILTKRRYLKYNKDAEAKDMIHMGSDHRCVMATFMIITPEKSCHCKTEKRKLDTTKHERRDQTEKVEKPELEKRYQEVIGKIKEKNRRHKEKHQRKQKMRIQMRKQKIENAEAEAKNENAEAEAEEVDGTITEIMVNKGLETTGKTGERHPGFRTVNDEAGHIVLHVEHVEHGMGERTMTTITSEETGREGTDSTEFKRKDTNGEQTEGVIEAEHPCEELPAQCTHSDEEAGSIVLHVST